VSPHATPRLVAVGALGVLALVLAWNAWHFPWRQGYDATASAHYAEVLGDEHRLPHRDETDVWHNPPLFFVVAGALYRSAETIELVQPGRVVQLFSALCVIGIAALTFGLARELFPDRRWLAPVALLLAVCTPVLVRAGSLFHPEPLATLLTTAALYVVVRAMRRERLGWGAGLLAGGLLGLANLTRTWALAALAAVLLGLALHRLWRRDAASLRALGGVAVAAAALVVPWLVVKAAMYGSPLAYSRPVAEQWRQHGRPASFWLDLSPVDVARHPYQPWFRNVLVPTIYADWWGDYWRVWRVPPELHDEPDTLPAEHADPLRRQSFAGLAATAAVLAGVVGLAAGAWRRRDAATATLVLSVALLALSFVGFLVQYPKQDGDNIKALYVLNAAPVLAVAGAYALTWLAARGRLGAVLAAATFLALAVPTALFVVLPA
jgi:4-amino-4-deoxy-L-arabinose transferase-like glycosyltransferase